MQKIVTELARERQRVFILKQEITKRAAILEGVTIFQTSLQIIDLPISSLTGGGDKDRFIVLPFVEPWRILEDSSFESSLQYPNCRCDAEADIKLKSLFVFQALYVTSD